MCRYDGLHKGLYDLWWVCVGLGAWRGVLGGGGGCGVWGGRWGRGRWGVDGDSIIVGEKILGIRDWGEGGGGLEMAGGIMGIDYDREGYGEGDGVLLGGRREDR